MRYSKKYETCPIGLVHSVRKLNDPLLEVIMRIIVSKTGDHHRAYCRLSAIMKELPCSKRTMMRKLKKGRAGGILGVIKKGRSTYYYPNWLLVYDTLTSRFQKIVCDSIPEIRLYVSKQKKRGEVPVMRLTETRILELTGADKEAFEKGLMLSKDRGKLSTRTRKWIKFEKE